MNKPEKVPWRKNGQHDIRLMPSAVPSPLKEKIQAGEAGERVRKTGTESRKRKPKAEACELRLAAFALPKGSGLATVRAKTCPKAGLSGAGGKTVAALAAGTGILRKTEALIKKVARPSLYSTVIEIS